MFTGGLGANNNRKSVEILEFEKGFGCQMELPENRYQHTQVLEHILYL